MTLAVHFIEYLEKLIYNAYEGIADSLHPVQKVIPKFSSTLRIHFIIRPNNRLLKYFFVPIKTLAMNGSGECDSIWLAFV